MTHPLDTVIAALEALFSDVKERIDMGHCDGYKDSEGIYVFPWGSGVNHHLHTALTIAKQLREAGGREESYLIWSNEHVAWWAAGSRGYCISLENAGRYSKEEAIKICNGANYDWREDSNPNELPIPESIAALLKNKLLRPTPPAQGDL